MRDRTNYKANYLILHQLLSGCDVFLVNAKDDTFVNDLAVCKVLPEDALAKLHFVIDVKDLQSSGGKIWIF
jgi:hypothetical protein